MQSARAEALAHRRHERRVESHESRVSSARRRIPNGFTTYIHNAAKITVGDGSANDNNLLAYFTRANWSLSRPVSARREPARRRFVAIRRRQRYGVFPALSRAGSRPRSARRIASRGSRRDEFAPASGRPEIRASATTRAQPRDAARRTRGRRASPVHSSAIRRASGRRRRSSTSAPTSRRWAVGRRSSPTGTIGGRRICWCTAGSDDQRLLVEVRDNIGEIRNRGVDLGLHTVDFLEARRTGSAGLRTSTSRAAARG